MSQSSIVSSSLVVFLLFCFTACGGNGQVSNLAITEPPKPALTFEQATVRKSKLLVSTNGGTAQRSTNTLLYKNRPVTTGATYRIISKSAGLTNEITLAADGTVSFAGPALAKVNADGPLKVTIQAAYQGKTATYDFTVTDHFSERQVASSTAVYNDTLYIVGGDDGTNLRDVWKSTDAGSTWAKVEVTGSFLHPNLSSYSTAAANGTIYVTGGNLGTSSSEQKRVWKSADGGKAWQELTTGTKFSARDGHTTLAIGTNIYVIGGYITGADRVWRSSDGDNWAQVTMSASTTFSARSNHSSVYIPSGANAGMYVIGGFGASTRLNDVWKSTDSGATWTQVTTSASTKFSARNTHSSVYIPSGANAGMYVIGGRTSGGASGIVNDVWKSTDGGANWTRVTANAAFAVRSLHSSVAFGQAIYVFGGRGASGTHYNDVWKSTDGGATWVNVHKNP